MLFDLIGGRTSVEWNRWKKRLLDSKRPLSIEALKSFKKYFDVDLTYNSNAIEGNTLTMTETKVILEDGL